MSGKKQRNKMVSMLIVVALVGTVVYLLVQNSGFGGVLPPAPTPPVDIGGGVMFSFSVFQAEHLTFNTGLDAWKYPSSVTVLKPYMITDKDTGAQVSNIQTCIFFNVISSQPITQVLYVCAASIDIYDSNRVFYKNIGTDIPISQTVANPQNSTNTEVTSSSMTAAAFQGLVVPAGQTTDDDLYYVLTLSNISAGVTFSNSTQKSFAQTGAQSQTQQLWWKFHLTQSGNVISIVNLGTEWRWT